MIAIRPLPTAFASVNGPVTLATPSCCCCCCCCVATVASAMTFDGRDGYLKARATDRSATAAAVGALAIPAAALMALIVGAGLRLGDYPATWIAAMAVTYIVMILWVYVIADSELGIGSALLRAAAWTGLFFAEFIAVLATIGLIWVATPLWIWLAWRTANTRNGVFRQPPPPAPPPPPATPPPPPPP